MQLTGSEIIIKCLEEQGVDTVFGYPGGSILNIYDELYKHQSEIRHILTSHEQGAAHAADGYARATGKVGVCMATSGPGATKPGHRNCHPPIWIPFPWWPLPRMWECRCWEKTAFRKWILPGVTMPVTKHSMIVKDVTKLADTIRRAFTIAKSGRPGPVLVDVTKDVTALKAEYTYKEPEEIRPSTEKITHLDIENAVQMIAKAKRPFIFVGGGAILSNAAEEVRTFVHKVNAPVAVSLMGKGSFPETDELYTGMIGMHGTKTSNLGVMQCDLLITLGARFSDRVTGDAESFAKNAKILQIDVDAAEINKNVVRGCQHRGRFKRSSETPQ